MVIFPILMCSVVALSMAAPSHVPYSLDGDSKDVTYNNVTYNNAEANGSGQSFTVDTVGGQVSSAGLIADASQTSDQGRGEGDSGENTGQQASQGSSNESQSGSNGKDSSGGQQTSETTTQTYSDNTGGSSGGLNNLNGSSSAGYSGQSNSNGRGSGCSCHGTPAILNHIFVSLGQGGSSSNGCCNRDGQNQVYGFGSAGDQQPEPVPFRMFN